MTSRRHQMGGTPLRNRLALHRFICHEFGYPAGMANMLDRLRGLAAGTDASDESGYATALWLYRDGGRAKVTQAQFVEYDANITALSQRLRMTGEHGRDWKPHQYLALLFTEHYLNRYFADPEQLRTDLNEAKGRNSLTGYMPNYTPDDLRTIAFQSATGSGKTLIMHAHILQYRHWLHRAGGRLNNILLLTPNEQMSAQHERELRESGLHARIFSSETGTDLFAPVEIIDLNKLAEKKGVKRVAVRDFGENNLVLVDEGHLGATGKMWRERRGELARGGFAFEYSATFNQITGKDENLRNAYGKCLLFDYPYYRFHADGYGKDYAITNLPAASVTSKATAPTGPTTSTPTSARPCSTGEDNCTSSISQPARASSTCVSPTVRSSASSTSEIRRRSTECWSGMPIRISTSSASRASPNGSSPPWTGRTRP